MMRPAWIHTAVFLLLVIASQTRADQIPYQVPGYERLRAAGGDWQREAGEVLFSELSCAACHQKGANRSATLVVKSGPDLAAAGDRLRAGYVRAYLADPAAIKPGTTMPDVLTGMEAARRTEVIEDLTHYVMSMRSKRPSTMEPVAGSAKTGRSLYLSAGCAACHGSKAMPDLSEKYAPGALARFLLAPLAARPSGRMPDQHLGKKDAAHLAAYLAPSTPKTEPKFEVDTERAKQGRKAFMSLGCAACHGKEPVAKTVPMAGLKDGCLDSAARSGVPRYLLTEEQRGALRSALEARAKADGEQEDPKLLIRRVMLQRNCFACHQREGLGGPAADVAAHFTSTKDDLGDLGRLPPPLDGVGRKLQRPALERVLGGRDLVRGYMRVRMPGFGDDLAKGLSQMLARADADLGEKRYAVSKDSGHAGRNDWGREIVGTSGYACIVCHDINKQPSLGIGAYDLAEMPKRLRPEWMRDFLLNPAGFPTGSRMPPFWPAGKPMNPKLGGGSTEQQIDSILIYLKEVDESLPPAGLADRATLVLKPEDRPIIFRTFLKGTGTHAIAVGFPGGMNGAFDALAVRWSMAWRGKFLDADGTWNQRYVKMEQPLGDDLVRLENTGSLAIVGHDDLKPVFQGYHVTKEGVPVFEYDLGALHVEDRIEPGANKGLKRTLSITGQTREEVEFRAQPPAGVTLQAPGGMPLPVRLGFNNGNAELMEEIIW